MPSGSFVRHDPIESIHWLTIGVLMRVSPVYPRRGSAAQWLKILPILWSGPTPIGARIKVSSFGDRLRSKTHTDFRISLGMAKMEPLWEKTGLQIWKRHGMGSVLSAKTFWGVIMSTLTFRQIIATKIIVDEC